MTHFRSFATPSPLPNFSRSFMSNFSADTLPTLTAIECLGLARSASSIPPLTKRLQLWSMASS